MPEFDVLTDHQALKTIYGPRSKPSAHIEGWILRLQPYNYRVCFVSSRNNIADVLSRLTKNPASQGYIQAVPLELRTEEIEEASAQAEDLKVGHTTPLWPSANGEVERENRSLLKAMGVSQAKVNKFLLAYRSTNHSTTGVSPAELLFRRKLIRVIGASRL